MDAGHFSDTDLARIRHWCSVQSAKLPVDELRISCAIGNRAVDIGEERRPWDGSESDAWTFMAVARLTYIKSRREWRLGVSDANGDFHTYSRMPTGSLVGLLDEIDADPMCAFWG